MVAYQYGVGRPSCTYTIDSQMNEPSVLITDMAVLQTIGVALGIVIGILTVGGVVVAVTRFIVAGSTKFETSIATLSDSINKLTTVVERGLQEVHGRVDKNDDALSKLNTKVAVIMHHLGITHESTDEHQAAG